MKSIGKLVLVWIAVLLIAAVAGGCASSGDTADKTAGQPTQGGGNGKVNDPDKTNQTDGAVNSGDKNTGAENSGKDKEGQPKIVAENKAFRVYSPAPNSEIDGPFVVKGQARVFEAAFSYSFEDGHNILAEGHTMADMGAPEWGNFEFTVTFKEQPTSPTGVLTIFEISAEDGRPINVLHIPLKFDKKLLKQVG
ncbi:Gmad2 immunoglobulin-like domain-containing protein [Paenibacillus sp. sptzw28]|uniref:Gmad2 immunoglobulin-like domain-containing protein n=1 Tax=Paenibacillus sp. sptzw28 TaxID=715179 RepID=UPI001C6E46FF|nr:Gmad2 immunoglobulin-like domain-containing protein [Paenibacillus sp. sptzw28]QYR21958.1 Gmad2 immunoglobulin-like domain-containing protein [Paenibacillus sp. sptzw28]